MRFILAVLLAVAFNVSAYGQQSTEEQLAELAKQAQTMRAELNLFSTRVDELQRSLEEEKQLAPQRVCSPLDLQQCSSEQLCARGTLGSVKRWRQTGNWLPFALEARRRGLSCGVSDQTSSDQALSDQLMQLHELEATIASTTREHQASRTCSILNLGVCSVEQVCEAASFGSPKEWHAYGPGRVYVREAGRRNLGCGTSGIPSAEWFDGNQKYNEIVDESVCFEDCGASAESMPHVITNYGNFTHSSATPTTLFLLRTVTENTAQNLRDALFDHDIRTLVVASDGGYTREAMSVAQLVHDHQITTYIPSRMTCQSACSHIWFSGGVRLADGQLGVHQFNNRFINDTEFFGDIESFVQTRIADYLDQYHQFDVPLWAQIKAFRSREMYFFDDSEMSELSTAAMDWSPEFRRTLGKITLLLLRHEQNRGR